MIKLKELFIMMKYWKNEKITLDKNKYCQENVKKLTKMLLEMNINFFLKIKKKHIKYIMIK